MRQAFCFSGQMSGGDLTVNARGQTDGGAAAIPQWDASEHYGNLVSYMRLKNMVPPTSDPAFMQQMMKKWVRIW